MAAVDAKFKHGPKQTTSRLKVTPFTGLNSNPSAKGFRQLLLPLRHETLHAICIKTSARESFSLPVIYAHNWMQWHKVLAESVAII